ncbi:uncharacterized protein LOC112342508 [Selaginella moellendorffii]|uniref:uncharacterized protein LOC112342508 n=1 Tax=Selaginella moellendorffii TaxID=88036 RepID=UPI000D1C68A1|nr:uncharacterized protein LOC112342508 [Selaginella moellendorffii]|eukprot:XP_024520218.1 uncharacterized protein LOC112342508 [Selaginella moellendorffii]
MPGEEYVDKAVEVFRVPGHHLCLRLHYGANASSTRLSLVQCSGCMPGTLRRMSARRGSQWLSSASALAEKDERIELVSNGRPVHWESSVCALAKVMVVRWDPNHGVRNQQEVDWMKNAQLPVRSNFKRFHDGMHPQPG